MLRRLANIALILPIPGYPLFLREVRRVRWYRSAMSLKRQALVIFVLVCGGLFMVWLTIPSPQPTLITASGGQVIGYIDLSARFWVVMAVMGLSLLANIPLDFRSVLSVMDILRGDMLHKRLDLLRLTPIGEANIVAAKHCAAQVRIWRMTILVASVRLFIIVILLFFGVTQSGGDAFLSSFGNAIVYSPGDTILTLFVMAVYLAVFTLEPLWRVQAMTALGMAISARVENSALAILTGVLGIFAVWITQMIVFGMSSVIFSFFGIAFLGYQSGALAAILPYIYSLLLAGVVYWFYAALQTRSLRYAVRAAFHDGP